MVSAKVSVKTLRRVMNQHQALHFMGAMAGIVAIFAIIHLARSIALRRGSSKPSALAAWPRKARNLLLRKGPGLPSFGHGGVIFLYVAINIILTFTSINTKYGIYSLNMALRTAWLTIANLVLVIFLSLKNTPLAFLTARSYERLNILHQVAGFMTVIFALVHGGSYTAYYASQDTLHKLTKPANLVGIVAGIAFLTMGFAGAVIRRWWYELFYYVHVSLWILSVVMIAIHQPDFTKKSVTTVIVVAGIWFLDRLVRFVRLLLYSANNSATLTPLPNGGTRVTLKKPPLGAVSGEHCFLWIPRIRASEMHPFTIASTDPLEFVVASYDGFTQDLHRYAVSHPGATLKASVEGSYGALPDPTRYDTVVFVAGGSGASFTVGMVLNMLKSMRDGEQRKKIIFVWMVKHASQLTWFATHLDTLEKDGRVSLGLYVTRSCSPETESKSSAPPMIEQQQQQQQQPPSSADPEKQVDTSAASLSDSTSGSPAAYQGPFRRERPDVSGLIRAAIDETPAEKRVLVLGCGPEGLLTQVRNTAAACIRAEGPGVELHCEQFGW